MTTRSFIRIGQEKCLTPTDIENEGSTYMQLNLSSVFKFNAVYF